MSMQVRAPGHFGDPQSPTGNPPNEQIVNNLRNLVLIPGSGLGALNAFKEYYKRHKSSTVFEVLMRLQNSLSRGSLDIWQQHNVDTMWLLLAEQYLEKKNYTEVENILFGKENASQQEFYLDGSVYELAKMIVNAYLTEKNIDGAVSIIERMIAKKWEWTPLVDPIVEIVVSYCVDRSLVDRAVAVSSYQRSQFAQGEILVSQVERCLLKRKPELAKTIAQTIPLASFCHYSLRKICDEFDQKFQDMLDKQLSRNRDIANALIAEYEEKALLAKEVIH